MSTWLHRIGSFSARNRRFVLAAWIVIAMGAVLLNRTVGGEAVDNFEVPGVESQAATDMLKDRFPERAGATAMVVFHTEGGAVTDPAFAVGIAATIDEIRALPEVLAVTEPLASPRSISPDATIAFASVQFDGTTAELGSATLDALVETADPAESTGVQVEFGGELPTVLQEETTGPAEAIGVIAALIILLFTFRSLIAMALPLVTALTGLVTGLSVVGLLSGLIEIPSVAPRLGTMIGLGVGIDYALFILSRHRDNIAAGMPVEESIGRTNATAGQAVVIAGSTVVVAILGLQLAGIPFVAALGYSASIVVAIAVVVAVTLLPALLGFAGSRVLGRNERDHRAGPESGHSGWVRWAHWVAHHPWRSSIAATVALLVLAVPVLDMQLGQADAGTSPTSTTQRRAYDLLADGFGAGFNGPTRPRAISFTASATPPSQASRQRLPPPCSSAAPPLGSSTSPTRSPPDSRGSSPRSWRCRSSC
ncbi:MAG: MMPL domain transmembrane transporter [Acidimicrobiaceae bacterium]|nr:MAG: MMPL domain transmembrane transporter [Acidimicrobiaceae bacterium]